MMTGRTAMTRYDEIHSANKSYWTKRARTYSLDVNQGELHTAVCGLWLETIEQHVLTHFAGKSPRDLRVLDIGTGPGFFAVILAKAGYRVTAIDLTPAMLAEAKKNAGALAPAIDFREMNAEDLDFPAETFDIVISRNLTWDLPRPDVAYREWHRVLRKDGMLLNFDANWYRYLYDDAAKAAYDIDRVNAASIGIYYNQNPDVNYDVAEAIAEKVPLSREIRPEWDIRCLSEIGFSVSADCDIWKILWSEEEKVNYASTPMFLIEAIKL